MERVSLAGSASVRSFHQPEPPGESLRILLVEDNLINQLVAVKLLEQNGYLVAVASNGRQALELLDGLDGAGATFDLVLMDLQMPVMDGFDATVAIRQRDRPGRRLPVIAVTANTQDAYRERCRDTGFDGFVAKPIRWPILKAAIEGCWTR